MLVDVKYNGKKLFLIHDNYVEELDPIDPYFYIIYERGTNINIFRKSITSKIVDIEETSYLACVCNKGWKYDIDPNYRVAKVICVKPTDVPDIAYRFISNRFKASAFNVKYVTRVSFDLDLRFFDSLPLYYGLDPSIIEKLRKLKVLVIDVEAINFKPILASVYIYSPFKEVEKDDVQHFKLPEQLDDLQKIIDQNIIIAGHNILGFDIPILRKNDVYIDMERKCFVDSSALLANWASSFQIGSARSLLDVSRALKEKVGITDTELDIKEKARGRIDKMTWEELVHYNVNDVVLTSKLLNMFFTFLAIVSGLIQVPLSVIQSTTAGTVAEYFLLHDMELKGIVPEYRAVDWRASAEKVYIYAQNYVAKNIHKYDVKMMYPSYVLKHKIDPTLLVDDGNAKEGIEYKLEHKIDEKIRFDLKSGLGLIYSTVLKLYNLRQTTKKLKKKEPLYENVDLAIKAILNALAYGVQGKRSGYAILGNVPCPIKIFLGTTRVTYNLINYLKSKGIKVIYSDSVLPNTPIVVRINGKIHVLPIELLYKAVQGVTYVENGKEYKIPNIELEVLSYDYRSRTMKFKPVKTLIRHYVRKKVVRCIWRSGYFEVTNDHSLISLEGLHVKPVEFINKDIEIASFLNKDVKICNLETNNFNTSISINVGNINEIVDFAIINSLNYKIEDGYLNLLHVIKTIFEHFNIKIEQIDNEYIFVKQKGKLCRIKYRFRIDSELNDLLYLVANYICDGSVSICKYSRGVKFNARFISSANDNKIEKVYNIVKKIFPDFCINIIEKGYKRSLKYTTPRGFNGHVDYIDKTKHVQIGSKIAVAFLIALAGKGSKKFIPAFVYSLDKDKIINFIQYLINADGSIYEHISKKHTYLVFSNTNRLILTGFSFLLSLINIKATISGEFRKNKPIFNIILKTTDKVKERYTKKYIEEQYEGYVYDLTVCELENFVGDVGLVVFHNTDSCFIEAPDKDPNEILSTINEFLSRYGLEVDYEGSYEYGYIISKKSYILFGNDIVIKGGKIKMKLKFFLPNIISKHFIDIVRAYPHNYRKIIRELIDSCNIEDLFSCPAQQLWRLIARDPNAVKRERRMGKEVIIVRTPWELMRFLYLKKGNPATFAMPSHAPLITMLLNSQNHTVMLHDYEPYFIMDSMCLYIPTYANVRLNIPIWRHENVKCLYYLNGQIYAVGIRNIYYILEDKYGSIETVPTQQLCQEHNYYTIQGVKADLKPYKLNIEEQTLREIAYKITIAQIEKIFETE